MLTSRDGSMTQRMTPRVPRVGAVAEPKLTPRVPRRRTTEGAENLPPRAAEGRSGAPVGGVSLPQLLKMDNQSISYLARKLINLSTLLNQDTVSNDRHYPSFMPTC